MTCILVVLAIPYLCIAVCVMRTNIASINQNVQSSPKVYESAQSLHSAMTELNAMHKGVVRWRELFGGREFMLR